MDEEEAYILLLLSDGNLPTGSFVASAGLESYATHGFLTAGGPSGSINDKLLAITEFVRDSVMTYARSAVPFLSDAHREVQRHLDAAPVDQDAESTLRILVALDDLYEATTLNHVARRASRSQGVALLTLYSKGFSQPPLPDQPSSDIDARAGVASTLIDKLKLVVRREDTPGHLPICWGVLTAALGLSVERSQFLHLFLHARGSLSAAVRMNVIGPYAAQQLLLHTIRPLVIAEAEHCRHLRTGLRQLSAGSDQVPLFDEDVMTEGGPAMTWPLGEILASRHDLQHSRIFNS
ncbi:unnamed protein product [Somion occarium]|uniref:Urease accessory protein UreF n=1 Tax=Somion occarium TaxID=3059160 RepID=A0ABP1CXP3_9APHY